MNHRFTIIVIAVCSLLAVMVTIAPWLVMSQKTQVDYSGNTGKGIVTCGHCPFHSINRPLYGIDAAGVSQFLPIPSLVSFLTLALAEQGKVSSMHSTDPPMRC